MKKTLIVSILVILLFGISGCDTKLVHETHDHDGDGIEDHLTEDHDYEGHHNDEEYHNDE